MHKEGPRFFTDRSTCIASVCAVPSDTHDCVRESRLGEVADTQNRGLQVGVCEAGPLVICSREIAVGYVSTIQIGHDQNCVAHGHLPERCASKVHPAEVKVAEVTCENFVLEIAILKRELPPFL